MVFRPIFHTYFVKKQAHLLSKLTSHLKEAGLLFGTKENPPVLDTRVAFVDYKQRLKTLFKEIK